MEGVETGREEGRNERGKNLSIFGERDKKGLSENSETRDTKTAVNMWDRPPRLAICPPPSQDKRIRYCTNV